MYGFDGEVVAKHHTITKVHEVLNLASRQDGLFD